ncbi:DNA-binding transcriptional regulator, LysR family [Polaromonas sp. OV174]|uniref:LysR substrate-binding domain-containing protein n=1 Tax=Polaromonas sp. OV174 TaxID=1855300 RepID=UPI0008F09BFD|nr:LysR substrate-binding domain-containing protein [Polaromonas sp. OV174]SFB68721.1 DNA-binding transcriptional regulator, LysR family [Polaromonas sp. OV174]
MNLLTSLRYLVALSEHRHFARAAQACHITQPALSNALRALEKEFGTPIVKRARSYAGLTPEGERVLASARRMLHEHVLLQQELASSADQPRGRLQLGVVPTAVPVAARFAAMLQAAHPGIAPVVRSLSSQEIEEGLDNLSLDLALGFTDRLAQAGHFAVLPQYAEHYFLVRRRKNAAHAKGAKLHIGAAMRWLDAAQKPLCLLTPEMHNRSLVDRAFAAVGATVQPVMETNSVLTLALSVLASDVCSVLPGALVGAVRSQGELEALPLVAPEMVTPVGFIHLANSRASRALEAALALAQEARWLQHAAQHSGSLKP